MSGTKMKKGKNDSFLSTREAAEQSGFSPRHIQNLITRGNISATRSNDGRYLIDKSEFYRVFPDAHEQRIVPHDSEIIEKNSENILLEVENKYLKELLVEKDRRIIEKDTQNEFLHKQLELAATEKAMLLETLGNNQKLLEHSREKAEKTKRKKIFGIF